MLFDDNYNFGMEFINTMSKNDKFSDILSPYESFLRGNSFKDEYLPYKKYTFLKIKPTTRKEKLLYEIMSLCFIINDLNLYLDLHNNDQNAFDLFKKYIDEERALEDKYIKEFGPITLNDTIGSKYTWLDDFAWENNRGDLYV